MLDENGFLTVTYVITVFQSPVIKCMVQYLNVSDLLHLRQVCQTFKKFVRTTGEIRKRVIVYNKKFHSDFDTDKVERLFLPFNSCLACKDSSDLLEKVLCSTANLQYLTFSLGICTFDCSLLPKGLTRLTIHCEVPDLLGLNDLPPNLEQLKIYGDSVIAYDVNLEKLGKLKVLYFYAGMFDMRCLVVPVNVEEFHYCVCNTMVLPPMISRPEKLVKYKYRIRNALKDRRKRQEIADVRLAFDKLKNLKEFTTTHGFDMNFGDKKVTKFFSNLIDDEIVFQFLE